MSKVVRTGGGLYLWGDGRTVVSVDARTQGEPSAETYRLALEQIVEQMEKDLAPAPTAAQIIDNHRQAAKRVGEGVTIECHCGEMFLGSMQEGLLDEEHNSHRDAERAHAAHIAEILAGQDR